MKKIVSTILVCVLLVGSLFALASCGTLSGKYQNNLTTLEFSGKTVVITAQLDVLGNSILKTYEAEYTIEENEDGEKTITFVYAPDAEQYPLLVGTKSFAQGEEEGKKYVKIGILKYTKVD